MEYKNKQIVKGASLTILGAIFATFGIIVASSQNLIVGILIIIASSLFWGYECLLYGIVELRLKLEGKKEK